MKVLVHKLQHTLMMISQVIRRMEDKQYILRLPHPNDSRARVLKLTDLGREKLLQAREQVYQAGIDYFAVLESSQREQFHTALEKLYHHYK